MIELWRRTADWAAHICREHNEEADIWAGKGARGREEEWVDTTEVVRSEVAGLCGFLDGSGERGVYGAGMLINFFHAGSGMGQDTRRVRTCVRLDADIKGCAMLMSNLNQWVDKCASDH